MKITETQRLSMSAVRSMCCECDLYTCGTNEQYDNMLRKVNALSDKQIITGADLYPIAHDILQHSKTEQDVASIMWGLGKKIVRIYDVEE